MHIAVYILIYIIYTYTCLHLVGGLNHHNVHLKPHRHTTPKRPCICFDWYKNGWLLRLSSFLLKLPTYTRWYALKCQIRAKLGINERHQPFQQQNNTTREKQMQVLPSYFTLYFPYFPYEGEASVGSRDILGFLGFKYIKIYQTKQWFQSAHKIQKIYLQISGWKC